ncbi:unnamed protein product [Arabis nemorensis]|uniref:POX domain-containing protein n=1 Tax=Arabis nemorensis TaxID=586526 RepID=A0A565C0Z0_9BRAS|nr:unnamed protein product [Arabis nemorensis]
MLGFNDDITSPLSAQIFDFCDPQLFQESGFTSASNVLEKSGSFHSDCEYDIAASIDFSSSSMQNPFIDHLLTSTRQDQFNFSTSGVQIVHQTPNNLYSGDPLALTAVSSAAHPPLQLGLFEEDCLSSVASYNLGLNPTSPSCSSFFPNSGLPSYMVNMNTGLLSSDTNSSVFPNLRSEINKPHDQFMDFQADNGGLFCTDSIKRILNPGDLQKGFGGVENQSHLVSLQNHPTSGPVEVTGLEDSALNKVGKLSPEQRKEKIHSMHVEKLWQIVVQE